MHDERPHSMARCVVMLLVGQIIVGAVVLWGPPSASAESPAESESWSRVIEEGRREFAWFDDAMRRVSDRSEPVLSHIEGTEGVSFPQPEEWLREPVPTPIPPTPEPVIVWTPTPYKQPGRCATNETKRVPYPTDEPERTLYRDRLFIAEELVPLDTDEVFGSEVVVVPYGPNSDGASRTLLEIYRVPCVPYRIRSTNAGVYYDTGLNALRNYSSGQATPGVLHPAMQQKLYGKERGGSPPRSGGRRR